MLVSRLKPAGVAAAAGILFASSAMSIQSAPQPGLARTELLRRDLSVAGREVIQVRVDFPKGVDAARHRHPGEEIVYVLKGALEYRLGGEAPITLVAGKTLFIPAGTPHAVRNVGDGGAVELATYIVEKGQPLVVPA